MNDRFLNYEELAAQFDEGRDFVIEANQKIGSRFTVLAPHGGKIEQGTSEIARRIAGEQYNLYLFEGRLSAGNRDLHVTSHRFFEKRADDLLKATEFAIGVHGRRDQDGSVAQIERDSLCDSMVLVSGYEQTHTSDLPHDELAFL